MIFKELLDHVSVEALEQKLVVLYPDAKRYVQGGAHQQVLSKLCSQEPIENTDHMTLHVEYVQDCGSEEHIWTVTYSLYRRYEKKYALEFTDNAHLLSALVDEGGTKDSVAYVARVLWELMYLQVGEEDFEGAESNRSNETEFYSKEDILNSIGEDVYDE